MVIQGTGRREEITFGNYHVTHVWTGNTLATSEGTTTLIPPEVVTVMRLTPILLLRFDDSDVIRAIADRQIERRSLHCIEFDTIRGQQTQNNEICVDAANGTVVSQRLGNDIIENTNFFTFAGALYPAKITYSVLNRGPQLEIAQTVTESPPETTNVLTAPPDARMHYLCTTYRRAIGQSTPQPRPGNRNGGADIAVRAMIGVDGKVHDPLVQSSERPDLNAEALSLVSQWVFLPAMCNWPAKSYRSHVDTAFRGEIADADPRASLASSISLGPRGYFDVVAVFSRTCGVRADCSGAGPIP